MKKLVKLFEPGRIGGMELKNRLVMGPLGHGMTYASKDGKLTDQFLAFYEARAKGGVGFIQLTVAALGRPYATGMVFSPGILSITTEEHIPSARRFIDAIHAHGTKVSFNITHHGSAIARAIQMRPSVEYPELNRVLTATGTKDPVTGFETHSMTREDIEGVTEAFARAALRGRDAGFDAVRIQACHAYLLRQFLSPKTNRREDEYGGTPEKRARFVCEIICRIRKEVGPDYPIIIRMNGDEHLEGGITLDEAVIHAQLFTQAGANAIDVSSGPPETSHWQFITMYQPYGALVPSAAAIKKAVTASVITVGKIDTEHGEQILKEGSADFIQMARALMAEPELPNKAREGKLDEIRPCIYCGWCQAGGTAGALANCTVNPALGRELEYRIEPARQKKNVMVIGGGPAGMESARVLAERGHNTSLYEQSDRLGGQWNLVASHIPEEGDLVTYLAAGLDRAGVKVYLNSTVDAQIVWDQKPDVVIIATGSKPVTLNVPGTHNKNIVQAIDVLAGTVTVGENVIVIGGRTVGLETALYLSERSKNVSVITRSQIARGIFPNKKAALFEYLIKYRVRLFPNCIVDSISEKGVNIWWNAGEPLAKENVFAFLPADTVVLAVGSEKDDYLVRELAGTVPEIHSIGDCAGKQSIFAAIRGGHEVGLKI